MSNENKLALREREIYLTLSKNTIFEANIIRMEMNKKLNSVQKLLEGYQELTTTKINTHKIWREVERSIFIGAQNAIGGKYANSLLNKL